MKRISLITIGIIVLALAFTSCEQADFNSTKSIMGEYSSEEAAYDEEKRKVVKTARISLTVDQLENSIIDLKSFLKPINGYVYNYEINNESYTEDSYQKNLDSTVVVEKVHPKATLSVRVPISKADSFINYVLSSDAQISSLQINDDDITEDLWEKNKVAKVYNHSGKAQKSKGNSKNISYDNNTSIDAIKAKALAAKMNYKTKHLWFDIHLIAQPFIKTKTTLAAKNYRTPMHVGLANALTKGWYICADIILGFVTIWPILLLFGIGIFFFKRYRPKTV